MLSANSAFSEQKASWLRVNCVVWDCICKSWEAVLWSSAAVMICAAVESFQVSFATVINHSSLCPIPSNQKLSKQNTCLHSQPSYPTARLHPYLHPSCSCPVPGRGGERADRGCARVARVRVRVRARLDRKVRRLDTG